MSGIVGSYFNTRGSGVVAKLGTDGQVFTSTGAGLSQGFEAVAGGAWNLISTFTSDGSDATASFTSGIDSTYDQYCFKLIGLHPETNNTNFSFNGSSDGGSNYNVTKSSTFWLAYHAEDGSATSLAYDDNNDIAQGTGVQYIARDIGNDNDQSISGWMYLFAPSSTTFVKHWMTDMVVANQADLIVNVKTAGYLNTTSAVDAIQFKFDSDDIQGGKIKLYGIS